MRLLMIMVVAVATCGPARAQRVFRASSIDVEQNTRLDNVEAELTDLRAIVTTQASAREPETKPARVQPPTESPPQLQDETTYVSLGDTKTVEGKPYKLQIIDDRPLWMPAFEATTVTTGVTQQATPVVSASYDRPVSARYTTDELRAQIRSLRPGGWRGPVYASVEPESWAREHLQSEHGYTAAQVNGLTQTECLILHDLRHGGKVKPTRSGQATVQRSTSVAVQSSSGCPDGQCPIEQPVYQSTYQPTYQAAGGGCPNGQCPTQGSQRVSPQRYRVFGGWFR